VRRTVVVLIVAALLGGCTLTFSTPTPRVNRLPPARSLVLPRAVDRDENRPLAETASDLLVRRLREAGEVLGTRQFLGEATAAGLGFWAGGFVERVQRGTWPTTEERATLQEKFGIQTLVATDVTAFEQVWGKYGKLTRAGLLAEAYHVPSDRVLWRIRGDSEVENKQGRSFQYALEQATEAVVQGIHPRDRFSLRDMWKDYRR
jgi:hypothetical protein